MMNFSSLIRTIREEARLTQSEFAKALGVSTVLIAMVETGQKEVSKKLIVKLAECLDVHPASITPFLFGDTKASSTQLSAPEKMLLGWGERMQRLLIKKRAGALRKYAD